MRTEHVLLLIFVIAVLAGFASLQIEQLFTVEKGFVKADVIEVNDNEITIGANCTAIIAQTTPERAMSIQKGLEGIIYERPNSHDLFVDALRSFNVSVDHVTLDKFDGRYYYSSIYLKGGNKVLRLDSKPSDAIAIALRADAPIYINKTLLNSYGENIC